nr:hypothetical protein KitaXyl93_47250 [Kitasatospora sp. Xyl93]
MPKIGKVHARRSQLGICRLSGLAQASSDGREFCATHRACWNPTKVSAHADSPATRRPSRVVAVPVHEALPSTPAPPKHFRTSAAAPPKPATGTRGPATVGEGTY